MRFIVALSLFAVAAFAQDGSDSDAAASDPADASGSGDLDDSLYYPCYEETGYGIPYCCDDGATTESGCEELDLDDEEIFSFEEFVGYCNTLSRPSCCTGEVDGKCIGATIY